MGAEKSAERLYIINRGQVLQNITSQLAEFKENFPHRTI